MRCPGEGPPEYSEANIQVLTGLEHIRRRPGMYIGATDASGLHHLLFGLVDESLAPNEGTPATDVRVTLNADGFVEVRDDRTPPTDLESAFGPIFTGGHGIWYYPTANALSEELTARVRRPGAVAQYTFRRGQLDAAMRFGGPPDDRGLTVRFRPDPDIFGAARFDTDTIRNRLRQCAFLHSGVRITFVNELNGAEDVFEFADGVAGYVKWLNADRTPLHPEVISVRGEADGIRYEVGLQWCAEEELSLSFANGYHTQNGGTHEAGLRAAVTRTVNSFLRERHPQSGVVKGEDARGGLTTVVSVHLADAMFISATRNTLGNPKVEQVLATELGRALSAYFEANPRVAAAVAHHVIQEQTVREAAQKARESVREARKRK